MNNWGSLRSDFLFCRDTNSRGDYQSPTKRICGASSSQVPYLSRPCLDKSVHTGSQSLRCSSSPQKVCRTFRGPHYYVSPHPPFGLCPSESMVVSLAVASWYSLFPHLTASLYRPPDALRRFDPPISERAKLTGTLYDMGSEIKHQFLQFAFSQPIL